MIVSRPEVWNEELLFTPPRSASDRRIQAYTPPLSLAYKPKANTRTRMHAYTHMGMHSHTFQVFGELIFPTPRSDEDHLVDSTDSSSHSRHHPHPPSTPPSTLPRHICIHTLLQHHNSQVFGELIFTPPRSDTDHLIDLDTEKSYVELANEPTAHETIDDSVELGSGSTVDASMFTTVNAPIVTGSKRLRVRSTNITLHCDTNIQLSRKAKRMDRRSSWPIGEWPMHP